MTIKRTLLASVAAAAITIAATNASSAQNAPLGSGLFDWSGFYAGAHIGYGRQKTKGCFDCGFSFLLAQDDLKLRGLLAGLHTGYNWQNGNLVYGVEGDASFMRWKKKRWDTPSTGESNTAAKVDMLASIRARLGVAVGNGLLYGTGGIAIPKVRTSQLNSGDQTKFNFSKVGGVFGGGYEWAQTNNIRWRLEGLYYVFDQKKTDTSFHSFSPGEGHQLKNAFTVRLGVSYYFK